MTQEHRNTICVEDAEVLLQTAYADEQYVLRLAAPKCAARAVPGSFIHIQCADDIPMRRPLSIMRANAQEGWIEVLYKVMGAGLKSLSHAEPGDTLNVMGPIGNGFWADPDRPLAVMVGGGVGIPPLVFLAEHIQQGHWDSVNAKPVAFLGSELPFPFELAPASETLAGAPGSATHTLAALDERGIPARLATLSGFEGCYAGYVTGLAQEWLSSLTTEQLDSIMIYACGPEPMLDAVAQLAREVGVPSQLCLEEYMACAVGGCAGCAVQVMTDAGPAMKRVCVDGPVFAGETIYAAT